MPPKMGTRTGPQEKVAEPKSPMLQEDFNAMMRNFMSTMGFSASKLGEQAAGQIATHIRPAGSYSGGYRTSMIC